MSVSILHVPFKKEFTPIVLAEENVAIPVAKGERVYYKVLYLEQVEPFTIIKSLDSLQYEVEYQLNELTLEDGRFAQWRMYINDFVLVKMNYPRSTTKWLTKYESTYASPYSLKMPGLLEFFTKEDDVPTLFLTNPLYEAQDVRITIYGIKYAIEKICSDKEAEDGKCAKPEKYTVIPLYALGYVVGSGR